MRRALLALLVPLAFVTPASASSVTLTDPAGDTLVPTHDIVGLTLDSNGSTITARIDLADAALPGGYAAGFLAGCDSFAIRADGAGTPAARAWVEQRACDELLATELPATVTVSGSVVTLTAPYGRLASGATATRVWATASPARTLAACYDHNCTETGDSVVQDVPYTVA